MGRPMVANNQDIFETVSHISKSSGRLHQTNTNTMANQRDLKQLSKLVSRRLKPGEDGKLKAYDSLNSLEKVNTGLMSQAQKNKIKDNQSKQQNSQLQNQVMSA